MKSTKSALLIGASGLVGSNCLRFLLEDDYYSRVVVWVRRSLPESHSKLEQHVVDFNRLKDDQELFRVNDVFCCLGTTIKQAGSNAAFYLVDFTYAHQAAEMALKSGAEQFAVVSALGADPKSAVFYNHVKGELERALREIRFKSLFLFRPSLLLGAREEFRFGEKIGISFARAIKYFLWGPLKKYRGIEAKAVAFAMIQKVKENIGGTFVFESDQIQAIYDKEVERLITRKLN